MENYWNKNHWFYQFFTLQHFIASLPQQKNLKPDDLIFEGVARNTHRKHLDDFGPEDTLVPLDGVGGAVLLVRAEAHRRGLFFPTFR